MWGVCCTIRFNVAARCFFYFPEQNYCAKRYISFECLLSHYTWRSTL